MIYTLTCNPSLDYVVSVPRFMAGELNRTQKENISPGGKGVNVSLVLKNLGYESTALGFIGGFTGDELERQLKECKISTDFIRTKKGMTRINTKILSDRETEINGMGPNVSMEELAELYEQLSRLKDGDMLVISGSTPVGLPGTLYQNIAACVADKNIRLIVDAAGETLFGVLQYRPFLIKPNKPELEELFGVAIKDKNEVIAHARILKEMGAKNVLVSMGGDGAILLTEQDLVYPINAPKGEVICSVGAGDAMVAGFLAGWLNSSNYEEALWMGLCAGSATAFSGRPAIGEEIEILMQHVLEF